MLIIRVEIEDADGNLLHSYTIDHHNKQHRSVLGEQCRYAFEGDQTVITYPEHPIHKSALASSRLPGD